MCSDRQSVVPGASYPPADPGPSWNVPRVSLPGLFGMQTQFQQEWWYYVGTLYDTDGTPFSIQVEILRAGLSMIQIGCGITGIGWREGDESQYLFGLGFGIGAAKSALCLPSLVVPPVDDFSYSAGLVPWLEVVDRGPDRPDGICCNNPFPNGFDHWHFAYLKNDSKHRAVGAVGSGYSIVARGRGYRSAANEPRTAKSAYQLSLVVEDKRGTIMEGQSGYVGPEMFKNGDASAPASYECAQPILAIQSGGTLAIDNVTRTIDRGYLWLDRQMIATPKNAQSGTPPVHGSAKGLKQRLLRKSLATKSLYVGDWMGFVFESGLVMVLVEFWRKSDPQWITGTKVDKPPKEGFGNLYYPAGRDTINANGGRRLRPKLSPHDAEWDYDINILIPERPDRSPHWQSPLSGKAYATAWQIDFSERLGHEGLPRTIYVYAVSDNCEILMIDKQDAFFEGAALVYADKERTTLIGHVFVEQMGFN